MAENESLDLGGPYARRWDVPFDSVRNGGSCKDATHEVEKALYGGLRKSLKQWNEYGVSLSDLLNQRDSKQGLRNIIRKMQGHQYARLFAAAAASSGPSQRECLRCWVDAILDTMFDQICHRLADKENCPTFYDVQDFTREVLQALDPAVERIVTRFDNDPNWRPPRAPSKEQGQSNPTKELMGMSLVRVAKP